MVTPSTGLTRNSSHVTNDRPYVDNLTIRLNLFKITAVATLAISFLVGALALAYQLPLITLASALIGLGAAVLVRDARHISSEVPKVISDFIDKNPQQHRTWIANSLSIDLTKDQQELKSLKLLKEKYPQLLDENELKNYENGFYHFLYTAFKDNYPESMQGYYQNHLNSESKGYDNFTWLSLQDQTDELFRQGYIRERYENKRPPSDQDKNAVKTAIYKAATAYIFKHCLLNKSNHSTLKNIKNVVLESMTTRTFKEEILRNTFTIFSWMLP